jgi:uncharacterized protein YdbL (DUF1318 family)
MKTFWNPAMRNLKPALFAILALAATPALAQRDPAYQAARQAGLVGELVTGYLGIVGQGTPALRAMVEDINIRRLDIFVRRAKLNKTTVDSYAFTMGCRNISNTAVGEKYQAPDGTWQTRGPGEPRRDSRCPTVIAD